MKYFLISKKWLPLLLMAIVFTSCGDNKKPTTNTELKVEQPVTDENAIPVGLGPDALFLTPDKAFLYVANVEDSKISVIDTKTDKVIHSIEGIKYPWGFVRLGNTNFVAVSGYENQVVIIDFTSHKITQEQTFNSHLGGITANKEGNLLFVINIDESKVLELDANTLKILKTYPTGKGPDGIGISANNTKLFVTNTGDGTISIIDIASKKTTELKTGGKPELVHPNHDNSLLFISNFLKNKIHIVDSEKGEIIEEIENIQAPEEAVLSEDGNLLYVVSFELSEVWVYDALNYEKKDIVYKTGSKPIGVMPVGNKLYVSNYGDNTISVIQK